MSAPTHCLLMSPWPHVTLVKGVFPFSFSTFLLLTLAQAVSEVNIFHEIPFIMFLRKD